MNPSRNAGHARISVLHRLLWDLKQVGRDQHRWREQRPEEFDVEAYRRWSRQWNRLEQKRQALRSRFDAARLRAMLEAASASGRKHPTPASGGRDHA